MHSATGDTSRGRAGGLYAHYVEHAAVEIGNYAVKASACYHQCCICGGGAKLGATVMAAEAEAPAARIGRVARGGAQAKLLRASHQQWPKKWRVACARGDGENAAMPLAEQPACAHRVNNRSAWPSRCRKRARQHHSQNAVGGVCMALNAIGKQCRRRRPRITKLIESEASRPVRNFPSNISAVLRRRANASPCWRFERAASCRRSEIDIKMACM